MAERLSCDVFCRVVDHYGDAGVAWRLAGILAREHGIATTLYIDDAAALRRIVPTLVDAGPAAMPEGVVVRGIGDAGSTTPAPIVVEAFGGGLPERYVDAMQRRRRRPVWIVLEYLSAEPWVDGAHGLASPPPALALERWFLFPGFTARSGGVLRERDVFARRDALLRDVEAQAAAWHALGITTVPRDALTVSLFCYESAPAETLLRSFAADVQPVVCVVPEGVAIEAITALAGSAAIERGVHRIGALTLVVAPFVEQASFDARLALSALNFVRGEDSFVRAQLMARPLVWQAYPQEDDAHAPKLRAFLERYLERADPRTAALLRDVFDAWNDGDGARLASHWPAIRSSLPVLSHHARAWARKLGRLPELAATVAGFARERL